MMRARHDELPDPVQRNAQILLLATVLGLVLVLRVAYLQTFKKAEFVAEAKSRRAKMRAIQPRRGDITDRNGVLMATTRDVRRVTFDPDRLPRDSSGRRPSRGHALKVARLLGSVLGMRPADVLNIILSTTNRPGEYDRCKIIKENVTAAEEAALRWYSRKQGYKDLVKGTVNSVHSERIYAGGDSSTALIGMTIPSAYGTVVGTGGLELWADTLLTGSVGWMQARVDPAGVPIPTATERVISAADGAGIKLTIDINVQRICAAALAECMREHTPAGVTAIVLDPITGDVLGMVSRPSCNPMDRSALSKGFEQLRNRALMLYEPGSVMKPITWCIALDAGVVTPSEVFACPGYRMLDGKRINCEAHRSRTPGPGENIARMVIAKSCNTATVGVGLRLGARRLVGGLQRFGLLTRTGIQAPGDKAGWVEERKAVEELKRGSTARIAFGQAVMVSPLALAAAYGAIVNHGVLMKPRLIQAITDAANRVIHEYPTEVAGRPVSAWVADEMTSYLRTCVLKGTGKRAAIPGYVTGGKTGTANKADPDKGGGYTSHMASFIGYIKAGDRPIVIAVVNDEPHNGYHGSVAAAPTWNRIARELMLHWHVAPTKAVIGGKLADATGSDGND